MTPIVVYARIYFECLEKAVRGIRRSVWTLLLPMLLITLFESLGPLLAPLAWAGGFLWGLGLDALLSAYLYFVGEVVANSTVRLSEFGRSLRAYFWAIVNLTFVIWIVRYLLAMVLRGNPNAGTIFDIFWLAVFILLNATPEVLYVKGTYGAQATLSESLAFIQANWIEWFLPNILLGAAAYFALQRVPPLGFVGTIILSMVLGALLHLTMVFRGHLFQALMSSTHRQRMFRYRASLG